MKQNHKNIRLVYIPPCCTSKLQLRFFPNGEGLRYLALVRRLRSWFPDAEIMAPTNFPRYLALYDLSSRAVLDGPGYGAIARNRYSQWTKRIIPRMWGHYRAEAEQIYPGEARLGANGTPTRLALWRFSGVTETSLQTIVEGVRASFAEAPGVLQLRVFQGKAAQEGDVIATIELAGATPVIAPQADAFGATLRQLNLTNLYMPYWR